MSAILLTCHVYGLVVETLHAPNMYAPLDLVLTIQIPDIEGVKSMIF